MLRQAATAKVLMSEDPGDVFTFNSTTKRPSPRPSRRQSISVKGVVVYLAVIVTLALLATLVLSLLNTA